MKLRSVYTWVTDPFCPLFTASPLAQSLTITVGNNGHVTCKALFTRHVFSLFLSATPLIFFTFWNVMCEHHHRNSFNPF